MTELNFSPFDVNPANLPDFDIVPERADGSLLEQLGFQSGVAGLAIILIIFALAWFVNRRSIIRKVESISLKFWFMAVWFLNFCIYDIGMYTGEWPSLLTNIPMAILHAFGTFILDSDVSAIHGPFHNNWFFMMCFSFSHLFAAMVSMAFVIKHFGFNILAGMRMLGNASVFGKRKSSTYVFWGINDASYNLADSIIRRHAVNGDDDFRIIVVRPNAGDDSDSKRNGMERLFDFISLDEHDLELLQRLGCLTTGTFSDIAGATPADAAMRHEYADILRKRLKLKNLADIISAKTTRRLHFFFLSDDERANILAALNITRDSTVNGWVDAGPGGKDKRKVTVYCHARHNGMNRVAEDEQSHPNIEVRIVDSSRMSVELLKNDVDLHPVNFVKVESDATVSSTFNSLVVGFSEVGQDAVKFLYEFGAFVKSGSSDDKVTRSGFRCHAVDNRMTEIAGTFISASPGMGCEICHDHECMEQNAPVLLHQMDCRGTDFHSALTGWIQGLDYVVLATGDDELNMSLAIRIFRLAIRYRGGLDGMCILVRIGNDRDGLFSRICRHYNKLWEAETLAEDNGHLHQRSASRYSECGNPVIHLFGLDSEIYTYGHVIDEDILEQARKFKIRYDNKEKPSDGADEPDFSEADLWDDEAADLMQISDTVIIDGIRTDNPYKGCFPTYSAMMRLRRVQSQNIANSLHALTKRRLAERALGRPLSDIEATSVIFRLNGSITYCCPEKTGHGPALTRVIDTLARTEHLRWNAAHEILGYLPHDDEDFKDEARLLHGCKREWHELTDEHKSYDYNTVDVSLGISRHSGNK